MDIRIDNVPAKYENKAEKTPIEATKSAKSTASFSLRLARRKSKNFPFTYGAAEERAIPIVVMAMNVKAPFVLLNFDKTYRIKNGPNLSGMKYQLMTPYTAVRWKRSGD